MAFIELYTDKLTKNFEYLDTLFKSNNIEWAVVSKLLCGNELYIKQLLKLNIKEICDARVSNLIKIKRLAPNIDTVYIKPPAKRSIKKIVQYADASFNTEYETIKWLSEEAVKQNKIHKVIIMIELGDLREGVMGDELMDFYKSVFELPNIKVTGIGTNLNCLHGVYPSEDKMVLLSLYKQLIEAKFNRKIPWVTGGTSVVIPLLLKKQLPEGINHFRVGEALFWGKNLITGEVIEGMETDVFKLFAEIIEITEKPINPIGSMGENPSGEEFEINPADYGKTHHRAILDLGVLDVANSDLIIPEDKNISIVGASSDMLVLDIENSEKDYHIGDLISFRLKYMAALMLFNSEYITKKIV